MDDKPKVESNTRGSAESEKVEPASQKNPKPVLKPHFQNKGVKSEDKLVSTKPSVPSAEEHAAEVKKKEEEAKKKESEDAEKAQTTQTPREEKAPQLVTLKSADGRSLEASIGDQVWKGTVIHVPEHQVDDVRRILEKGGYYLKD